MWRPVKEFRSSASPSGFPYFTAREQRRLLRYRPRFRHPDKAARPVNLIEADSMGAGPLSADISELSVDVEIPEGKTLAIDDPVLIEEVKAGVDAKHELALMRSHRAMTDCRPLSISVCNRRDNYLKKQECRSINAASAQTFTSI